MKSELKKILYVEDEQDIRYIAKIALVELGGFDVKFCVSGREAIDQAELFKPDLIILDVMMPDLDGPGTLLELQKLPGMKDIPAIFMTARVQSSEIIQYKEQEGVVEVIAKPFDPVTLADNIRKCWEKI